MVLKSELLRVYKSVHTWTGIVAGLALFIAFYAGAWTMLKEPIAQWARGARPVPAVLNLQEAPALIGATLQAHPEAAKGFDLMLPQAAPQPGQLRWQAAREAGDEAQAHAPPVYRWATWQPGGAVFSDEALSPLPQWIDTLHRVVGLPADTDPNRLVMGVVAMLYAVALVSGLILLLPTLVKDFFALRVGPNLKRMWLDAHNVVGIVSLPFHLVMAITAVVFAFHDDIYQVQNQLVQQGQLAALFRSAPASAPPRAPTPVKGAAKRDPAEMLPPARLLDIVRAASPGFEPRWMQYQQPAGPKAAVRIWGRDPADVTRSTKGDFVALDPYSGRVLNADILPGQRTAGATALVSVFALHFGTYGGELVRWLYFLLGLGGAFLFYSGNLLWVESRRKAQRREQPNAPMQSRATRWMAAATVGVCLGCASGLALTVAAARWWPAQTGVAPLMQAHQTVYYVVFGACVLWALVRGAPRAAVNLLWVTTLASAAIPMSAWLTGGSPTGQAWMVDVVGALLAAGWAWLAQLTARRVRAGRVDSVWSALNPACVPPRT